jgi:hypothetical protein
MSADSPYDSAVVEASIRDHVSARASELGGAPRPADVDLTWGAFETPPGVRLFRAHWADHSGERALTGVWIDGDLSTRPLDAIDLLLHRWRECRGRLPNADILANACAFLLDAGCRYRVVMEPLEGWLAIAPASAQSRLHGPVYVSGREDLPLAFYWVDTRDRFFRVDIGRDRDGRIAFDSTSLQEAAPRGEPQSLTE